jgi:holo-[acyl-carrier protein] synthase
MMIGIDIVQIQRIEDMFERFGNKAFKKFLCDTEIQIASSIPTAAGFFAAKEAVSKALGIGICKECGFADIQIHKDSKKAPYFTLSKHLIKKFRITDTSLSITHDGGFAIAVAAIEGQKISSKKLFHDSPTTDKL